MLTCLLALFLAAPLTEPPLESARIVEASPVPKVPVDLSAPLKLSAERYRWFRVNGYVGAITWECSADNVIGIQEFPKPGQLFGTVEGGNDPTFSDIAQDAVVVWRRNDGLVTLSAYGVVNGKAKKLDTIRILCGPQPPPVPPGPTPTPVPPTPPAPIPEDGFRVLIVFESSNVTANQANIINSRVMRDYLDAKCAKGPDGKTTEYRILDKDTPMGGESELWKKAMARPRGSLPSILISTGKTGTEEALPSTLDATMTLLRKYGGQ